MTDIMVKGTEERFDVKDGQRPLTFMGWLVAEADSQSGHDVRWTELTLYKTLTGKYILEKIGRSDVFHKPDCRRKSKGVRHDSLLDATDDHETALADQFVPCDDCHPTYDIEPAWVERDISAVARYEDASALVASLFRRDADNMPFLSRVARTLLDAAADRDDDIREVVSKPADVT